MRSESPSPALPGLWLARLLALVLGLGALALGAVAIDEAGRRVPGDNAEAVLQPMRGMVPGAPVLMGNSVAKSALDIEHLRNEVGQRNFVDLTLHGSGPTTWYVLFSHHLATRPEQPKVVVLIATLGWLTHTVPAADRDYALEIAQHNDPVLAELLGTDTSGLGWERRIAARLRVRDALVNLLARPMALAALGPQPVQAEEGPKPLERAIQMTLGRDEGANLMRGASLGDPTAGHRGTRVTQEIEPAFYQLLKAVEASQTRLILVLLPQREVGPVEIDAPTVLNALPRNAQLLDMTQIPFEYSDYRDNQHFSPAMHNALSQTIAYDVSLMWVRRSARVMVITDRPQP